MKKTQSPQPLFSFALSEKFAQFSLIFLFIIGLILRLGPYFYLDYMEDELHSIAFARQITSVANQIIAPVDDRPPLFYLFVKALLSFSHDRIFLRFAGLFCSLVCIPIGYWLFPRTSRGLRIFTTAILAFSPFVIDYAWQLRDYSLLLPLSLINAKMLFSLLEEKKNEKIVTPQFLLFLSCSLLGCLINYIYLFFLMSLFAATFLVLFFANEKNKQTLRKIFFLALAHIPIFILDGQYLLFQKQMIIDTTEWIPQVSIKGVINLIVTVSGAGYFFDAIYEATPWWTITLAMAMTTLYVAMILVTLRDQKLQKVFKTFSFICFSTFLISVFVVLLTSLGIGRSLFLPRTFVPSAVMFALATAIFLYSFIKYLFWQKQKLIPLFLCIFGLTSYCYFDSYLDRYPFVFADPRQTEFAYFQPVIDHLKPALTEDSELVLIPPHYQQFFLTAYFPEKENKIGELASQVYGASYQSLQASLPNPAPKDIFLVVLKKAMYPEYYSEQEVERYKQIIQQVESICGQKYKIYRNTTHFIIYRCELTN
jgi:hypothetical protein